MAEDTTARAEKAKIEHDGEDNEIAAEASAEAATFRLIIMAWKERSNSMRLLTKMEPVSLLFNLLGSPPLSTPTMFWDLDGVFGV